MPCISSHQPSMLKHCLLEVVLRIPGHTGERVNRYLQEIEKPLLTLQLLGEDIDGGTSGRPTRKLVILRPSFWERSSRLWGMRNP